MALFTPRVKAATRTAAESKKEECDWFRLVIRVSENSLMHDDHFMRNLGRG